MRYDVRYLSAWVEAIVSGDRRALSQAISLCERSDRQGVEDAMKLLSELPRNVKEPAILAITGPPGVGKSTFVASMGKQIVSDGARLAVMSIDPSSTVSGGSILGDKMRMPELAGHPDVYIRPSPSQGAWGGLHPRSYEVREILRVAGYDYIMIETVGVGQSEVEVRRLVDMVILLMQPGSGDEVQMIKRGIHEWADFFVINKADSDMLDLARSMKGQFNMISRVSHQLADHQYVALHSANDAELAASCWASIKNHYDHHMASIDVDGKRMDEKRYWLKKRIDTLLLEEARRTLDLDLMSLSERYNYPEAMQQLLDRLNDHLI